MIGDDSDVEAGRCCPHCRRSLTDHNVAVWGAGYAVATRHHADEAHRVQAAHMALEIEHDKLACWKAEALPVMAGLQELGRALGVRLGKSITARESVDLALDLRNERDAQAAKVSAVEALLGAEHDDSPSITAYGVGYDAALRDVRAALKGAR